MGTFYTGIQIAGYPDMTRGMAVDRALVDTGSELTWAPATGLRSLGIRPVKKETFTTADGSLIKRDVGFAVIRLGRRFTIDEVVFAQPGDLALLGARTLEGLGLIIDARRKRLVAAGPAPAATAIRPALARQMGIVIGSATGKAAPKTSAKPRLKRRRKTGR
jgi:predicted aspartyl protease